MISYDDLSESSYDFSKIPFDRIVKVGQRSLLYRDLFTVSWLLGRYCNYRCSYCWPYARSNTKDHRPTEVCIRTIDEIKRQARDNGFNSFHFSLSGGEPSFHPGYLEILGHLASDISNTNYTSVHMTSNCSRPIEWFEKYCTTVKDFHRASITASFHAEHLNTDAKVEGFADKLIYCQHNDVQITINMVMVPNRFEQDWKMAMYFHEKGINVTLKPQSDPTASRVVDGYTREQLQRLHTGMPQRAYTEIKKKIQRPSPTFNLPPNTQVPDSGSVPQSFQVEMTDDAGNKWFMDQAERFNAFNFNNFRGWMCESGFRGIIIREPDGSIKRSYSCSDQPLGNIETGFRLFDSPRVCQSNACVSSADSKIPKHKVI